MRNDFTKRYDVVVAGGGMAGVAAALAAARRNQRVALVEKMVLWGGLATAGLVFIYLPLCDGNGTQVTFGISEELLKAGLKYGPGDIPETWRSGKQLEEAQRYRVFFSPASMVLALDDVLVEAGIDLWLDSRIIDVERSAHRLEALVVANKSGIGRLEATNYVDATGDADLAWLGGIDCPTAPNALACWVVEHVPEGEYCLLAPHLQMSIVGGASDPNLIPAGINGLLVSKFVIDGRRMYRDRLVADYATGKADRKSRFPLKVPAMADLRHTRRIPGVFTLQNQMKWQGFEDSIGMVADWRRCGEVWEIPYRTLITPELENLIGAGRCIASHDDAWEVTRVIQAAALTGEAAGTAAAVGVQTGCAPLALDYRLVQEQMRAAGNRLHFEDVYKH